MTESIKEKLDRLAEFHAQADTLDLKKRALLDDVKIPAEVEAIVKAGYAAIEAIDAELRAEREAIAAASHEILGEITVPDEVKALLAEIDARRNEVRSQQMAREEEAANKAVARKERTRAEFEAKTRAVYDDVAARKAEIDAEFSGAAQAVRDNIAKLENEIKGDVKQAGQTVKGQYFMAVYNKGRVTWNTDKMEAWMVTHPFLAEARKEGEPSISIRHI
jgi:hypothetical protein